MLVPLCSGHIQLGGELGADPESTGGTKQYSSSSLGTRLKWMDRCFIASNNFYMSHYLSEQLNSFPVEALCGTSHEFGK